jgi:hypothetical protein
MYWPEGAGGGYFFIFEHFNETGWRRNGQEW